MNGPAEDLATAWIDEVALALEAEVAEVSFKDSVSCFNNIRDVVNACVDAANRISERAPRPRRVGSRPVPISISQGEKRSDP